MSVRLRFAAILLAAGRSSRFGQNKMLKTIEDKTLIEHSIELFQPKLHTIDPLIVVIGAHKQQMLDFLKEFDIDVVYNQYHRGGGMVSSIRAGLSVLRDRIESIDGIFIHPADIPFVGIENLEKMIDEFYRSEHRLILPSFKNQRGHPVLVRSSLYEELLKITDEKQGLRGFIEQYQSEIGYIISDSDGILKDIDTTQDMNNM